VADGSETDKLLSLMCTIYASYSLTIKHAVIFTSGTAAEARSASEMCGRRKKETCWRYDQFSPVIAEKRFTKIMWNALQIFWGRKNTEIKRKGLDGGRGDKWNRGQGKTKIGKNVGVGGRKNKRRKARFGVLNTRHVGG